MPARRPYRTKYGRRISGRRYPRYTVRNTARRVVRKELKKQEELKGYDINFSDDPITWSTTSNSSNFTLNVPSIGASSYERIGRKIRLKSVRISLSFKADWAAAKTTYRTAQIRWALIWDSRPTDTLPTFQDVFGYTDDGGSTGSKFTSPQDLLTYGRFRLIRNKVITLEPPGLEIATPLTNFNRTKFIDEYVPLRVPETTFHGNTNSLADINSGALYLFLFTDLNASQAYGASCSVNGNVRIRFSDL